MAYVGTPIDTRNTFQSLQGKRFNGDGSTTAFTLDVAPSSTLDIEVFVGNVRQDPNSAYTLSGTTLTFTGAPPSGTNNIYVVHQAKSVGTIDVPSGGVQSGSLASTFLTGQTDIGGAIADADLFLVDDGAGGTLRKVAASRIKTYAATTTATDTFAITGSTPTLTIGDGGEEDTKIVFDGNAQDYYIGLDDSGDEFQIGKGSTVGASREFSIGASGPVFNEDSDTHDFRVETDDNTHAFFIHGAADRISIGQDGSSNTSHGFIFPGLSGSATFIVATDTVLNLNREDNGSGQNFDGTLVNFLTQDSNQGSISVSGSTVSYNAFSGSHWSRLADNSQPTILRGTVMESIATMCDWYRVKFTIPEIKDSNGKITQQKDEHAYSEKPLPEGKSVGDTVKHTHAGVEYDAVIEKQLNEQLPMCKISDTEDSKSVYGVFSNWDNEPDDGVNDMLVTGLGAFVVRVHKDETVAIGDLLSSKGDGTAKKQADDILRASTIAKVTSTTKTITHADGSYCVPCTLHCG